MAIAKTRTIGYYLLATLNKSTALVITYAPSAISAIVVKSFSFNMVTTF
jgi:hypothetical protein